MSEISDLIAAGEQLKLQRELAAEFHQSHDQTTHGNWADGVSDLEAKSSINVGDVIRFIPEGGTRSVTIKVTGKDRGRGGGIFGVRVVGGVAKTGVNHYQTPGVDKIEKVTSVRESSEGKPVEKPAVDPVKERMGTMKERIAAKTAAELEKIRAKQAKEIEEIKAQKETGATYEEILNKPKDVSLEEMRKKVAEEVSRRDAEIKAAYYEPSAVKINETGLALPSEVRNGIQQGREAMKAAGLKGDYGTVEVKEDDPSSSRYGGYYAGLNRIVMNPRNLPNKTGDGAFTFTHEYGHHVDKFEARRTDGTDHSKSAAFKAALRKTQAYQTLVNNKADLRGRGRYASDPSGRSSARLTYLLKPTELFARAFAQWATMRGGSPEMRSVLERRRGDHWAEADFAPLMEYFDKNFGERRVRTAAGAARYGQSIGQVIAADEEE